MALKKQISYLPAPDLSDQAQENQAHFYTTGSPAL